MKTQDTITASGSLFYGVWRITLKRGKIEATGCGKTISKAFDIALMKLDSQPKYAAILNQISN